MKKDVRSIGAILGYSGAAISAVAYLSYGLYFLLRGDADTNIVTWGLWAAEALLSFRIYKAQTGGDFAKYAEEMVASIGCFLIALVLCLRAALTEATLFASAEWVDGVSLLLVIVVYLIYRHNLKSDNVWPATIAFQGIIIFSALPLARSTFENPSEEPLLPWVGWAIGFALQLICVIMRREGRDWYRTLPTPINYLFWHALIAGIVYFYLKAA